MCCAVRCCRMDSMWDQSFLRLSQWRSYHHCFAMVIEKWSWNFLFQETKKLLGNGEITWYLELTRQANTASWSNNSPGQHLPGNFSLVIPTHGNSDNFPHHNLWNFPGLGFVGEGELSDRTCPPPPLRQHLTASPNKGQEVYVTNDDGIYAGCFI